MTNRRFVFHLCINIDVMHYMPLHPGAYAPNVSICKHGRHGLPTSFSLACDYSTPLLSDIRVHGHGTGAWLEMRLMYRAVE